MKRIFKQDLKIDQKIFKIDYAIMHMGYGHTLKSHDFLAARVELKLKTI